MVVGTVDGTSDETSLILSTDPASMQQLIQRVARKSVSRREQSRLQEEDYRAVAEILLMNARGDIPSLQRCLEWPVEQMLGANTPTIEGLTGAQEEYYGKAIGVVDHCSKLGGACLFEVGYRGTQEFGQWEIPKLGKRAYRRAQELLEDLLRDHKFRTAIPIAETADQQLVEYERCGEHFDIYAKLLGGFRTNVPQLIGEAVQREEPMSGTKAMGAAAAPALVRVHERAPPSQQEEGVQAMLGMLPLHKTDAEAKAEEQKRVLHTAWRLALLRGMDLTEVQQSIERRLIGQPEAVQTIVGHLRTWRSGTHDPRKPFGMLCVGPTGVGKTYTAEVLRDILAEYSGMPVPIRTINGAEYTYPSDINELKGAARGFIRSDEEGIMTKFHTEVQGKPFSVFVVDELTKGHGQLRNFMMSLLDRGVTTDNRGKDLEFYGTLFVLTSNLGYSETEGEAPRRVGFGDAGKVRQDRREDALKKIRRHLSSEFINRLYLIPYDHLTLGDAERIFDIEIGKIAKRYTGHGVFIECDPAARSYLLNERGGFTEQDGARKLNRVLAQEVNAPIAGVIDSRIGLSRGAADGLCEEIREMVEGKRTYDLQEITRKLQPPQDLLIIRIKQGKEGIEFVQRYR